jgi:hypothetical protein
MTLRRRLLTTLAALCFAFLTSGQDACQPTTTNTPDEPGTTGRQAPAKTAQVGDSITLTGNTEGQKIRVTVLGVIDPAIGGEFDQVTAGKRRVGTSDRCGWCAGSSERGSRCSRSD